MPPNERSMLPKDCALITRTLVMRQPPRRNHTLMHDPNPTSCSLIDHTHSHPRANIQYVWHQQRVEAASRELPTGTSFLRSHHHQTTHSLTPPFDPLSVVRQGAQDWTASGAASDACASCPAGTTSSTGAGACDDCEVGAYSATGTAGVRGRELGRYPSGDGGTRGRPCSAGDDGCHVVDDQGWPFR